MSYQNDKMKAIEMGGTCGMSWKTNLYKRIARIPAEKRHFGMHVTLDGTVEVDMSGVGCDG
jgi:hypothetical protein